MSIGESNLRKLIGKIILWFIKGSYEKKEDYYNLLCGFFTTSVQIELDQMRKHLYGNYKDYKTKKMLNDTIEKIVKDLNRLMEHHHEQEKEIITSRYESNVSQLDFKINEFKEGLKQEAVIDDIVARIKRKQL
tara:strand:- start:5134 stop:5532 length:399 start_codon:yes stop_codon:yes gene_type:complete